MKREKEVEFRVRLSLSMQVTKVNLVADLQIMLSNVPDSCFYLESCNTERGFIDQLYIELYIELGFKWTDFFVHSNKYSISLSGENVLFFSSKKYVMTSMTMLYCTFDFVNVCKIKCSKCASVRTLVLSNPGLQNAL